MSRSLIRSMTGYGGAERDLGAGRLRVEIRTVNHRYLNVRIRTPSGLERHQAAMERALKGYFSRGQVEVNLLLDRGAGIAGVPPVTVDMETARAYVAELRALQSELGLDGGIDVGVLTRFRDIFRAPEERIVEVSEEEAVELLNQAAEQVVRMREEEGARMAADLSGRLDVMDDVVTRIEGRAPGRLLAERDRLRAAIGELLEDRSLVDEDRLAREVAHLAERWDIHEEIVRFRSHLVMFREALIEGNASGVGKRFGFIAQEILREANTIGSKANDGEIARDVVLLKEEIERLREQLENVE